MIPLDLFGPVTELALVEEPIDDLIDQRVYECVAANGKDLAHPISST